MKHCNVCSQDKAPTEFYLRGGGRIGRMHLCKACHRRDVNENRALKAEFYRARGKLRRDADKAARRNYGVIGMNL
jgi:hypothetical protein